MDVISNRSSLIVPLEVLRLLLSPTDIPESILGFRPLSITLFLALIPTRFTSSFIASRSDITRLGAVLRRTVEGRAKGVAVRFPLTGVANALPALPCGVAGTVKWLWRAWFHVVSSALWEETFFGVRESFPESKASNAGPQLNPINEVPV